MMPMTDDTGRLDIIISTASFHGRSVARPSNEVPILTSLTADVVVLGLGAFGSAALYQLARRGVQAIGIDRFAPPHDRGSSHGATRITRVGVGEGEDYVPFVRRSHAIWRELEEQTGRSLKVDCGALVFASRHGAGRHHGQTHFVQRSVAAARRFDVEHEVLDAAAIASRFPQFGLDGSEVGYFEPGGGFVRPEACIAAQLEMARRHGAAVVCGESVVSVVAEGDGVVVSTERSRIVARRAIAAVGPWTPALAGGEFRELLAVHRQTLHWFVPEDAGRYAPDRFPVFIWMHGRDDDGYFYGFPIADEHGGVKLATEQYEQRTDPDDARRTMPDPAGAAALFATHVDGRLRGVTSRCARSVDCFYTVTPDHGFIVDRHPRMPSMTVVSACSGHGFKHSAGMGEALAEQVIGEPSRFDLAPFALARFATTERLTA